MFATWINLYSVVVGADAENTTLFLKTCSISGGNKQHFLLDNLPLQDILVFFPACARIHSEIYLGITPA